MSKQSAGLLLFRRSEQGIEVLLVHPGGPYWMNKDFGAWSIPKGEIGADEDPVQTARREFSEELGCSPIGEEIPLKPIRQQGGKVVHAWAIEGELEPEGLRCNTFQIEWPPRSGRLQEFPEIDRAAWFPVKSAMERIHVGQRPLLLELQNKLEPT